MPIRQGDPGIIGEVAPFATGSSSWEDLFPLDVAPEYFDVVTTVFAVLDVTLKDDVLDSLGQVTTFANLDVLLQDDVLTSLASVVDAVVANLDVTLKNDVMNALAGPVVIRIPRFGSACSKPIHLARVVNAFVVKAPRARGAGVVLVRTTSSSVRRMKKL